MHVKKSQGLKRLLALVLTLAMMVGMISTMGITAKATTVSYGGVTYVDENADKVPDVLQLRVKFVPGAGTTFTPPEAYTKGTLVSTSGTVTRKALLNRNNYQIGTIEYNSADGSYSMYINTGREANAYYLSPLISSYLEYPMSIWYDNIRCQAAYLLPTDLPGLPAGSVWSGNALATNKTTSAYGSRCGGYVNGQDPATYSGNYGYNGNIAATFFNAYWYETSSVGTLYTSNPSAKGATAPTTGFVTFTSSKTTTSLTSVALSSYAPKVGTTLTTTLAPAGATASYQWYRVNDAGAEAGIAGATGSSYTPTTSDIGYFLKVVATGTGAYSGTVSDSTAKNTTDGKVVQVKKPLTYITLSSTAPVVGVQIGTTLAPAGATATYQWYQVDDAGKEVAITGANSATYTPKEDDIGFFLKVSATGTGDYTGTVSDSTAKNTTNGKVVPNEVNLSYNVNGGSVPSAPTGTQKVKAGVKFNLPNKTGATKTAGGNKYVLVGWLATTTAPTDLSAAATIPTGTLAPGAETSITANTTFYAVWGIDKDGDGNWDGAQRKVIYKAGTAGTGADYVQMVPKDEATNPAGWFKVATLAESGMTVMPTGNVFDGWANADKSIYYTPGADVAFVPDGVGSNTMTVYLTSVPSGTQTVFSMTAAIANPDKQSYNDGDKLVADGVSVEVTYRSGTVATYDTPAKIAAAGIVLTTTPGGVALGGTLGNANDGDKIEAALGGKSATTPESISVGHKSRNVTLTLVGGAASTAISLNPPTGSAGAQIVTSSSASGSVPYGETWSLRLTGVGAQYTIKSVLINDQNVTSTFTSSGYDVRITGDTSIVVILDYAKLSQKYNLFANVLGGHGTIAGFDEDTIGDAAPMSATAMDLGSNSAYTEIPVGTPVKISATEINYRNKIAVQLQPETGYDIANSSIAINGTFVFPGDPSLVRGADGKYYVVLPKNDRGYVKDNETYYVMVAYGSPNDGTETIPVEISSRTMHYGNEISSVGTGNEVTMSKATGYSESPMSFMFKENATVLYSARPGTGYQIASVIVDGVTRAYDGTGMSNLMTATALTAGQTKHTIVVVFSDTFVPNPGGDYSNIDVDGDGIPDINVDTDKDGKPDLNLQPGFKPTVADAVTDPASGITYYPTAGAVRPNPTLNVDTNGSGTWVPSRQEGTATQPGAIPSEVGVWSPDKNLDYNGDGRVDIPQLNKTSYPSVKPAGATGTPVKDEHWNPDTDMAPGSGYEGDETGNPMIRPTVNVDLDGDGKPDVNVDTDGDGLPDVNLDNKVASNLGTPVTDPATGKVTYPNYPTDGTGPQLNVDTNPNTGAWSPSSQMPAGHIISPDKNVDTTGDGRPNIPQVNEGSDLYKPVDANGDGVNDNWKPNTPMSNTSGYVGDETGPITGNDPTKNVDVDGDGKPDVNIDTDYDGLPDTNLDNKVAANLGAPVTVGGKVTYPNYPADGTGPQLNVDTNPDTGRWSPSSQMPAGHIISPDKNIDTNGDGRVEIPTISETGTYAPVDANNDGVNDYWKPNTPMSSGSGYRGDETGNPLLNRDNTGDGKPDTNVDVDGDGTPDVNVDTDQDGKPDTNLDNKIATNLGTPVTDPATGKVTYPNYPTDGTGPQLNVDTNPETGNWSPSGSMPAGHIISPDKNIDTTGNGRVDIPTLDESSTSPYRPVDTNGDGINDKWKPATDMTDGSGYRGDETGDPTLNSGDVNVDVDGDGKPDVNIDTDKDGKPDVNLDNKVAANLGAPVTNPATGVTTYPNYPTDGTGPQLNVDTNPNTGRWSPSAQMPAGHIISPDKNIDTNGDGRAEIPTLDESIYVPVDTADSNGVNDNWKPTTPMSSTSGYFGDETGDPTVNDGNKNIDVDGDGKPDVNIDTDHDGKPDVNLDNKVAANLGTPVVDPVTGVKTYPNYPADGVGPQLNVDTNPETGKWSPTAAMPAGHIVSPDKNIDITGNGKVDIATLDENVYVPVDTKDNNGVNDKWNPATPMSSTSGYTGDETGNPTLNDGNKNVDVDGDGKPDVNIDTDYDGKPDTNLDNKLAANLGTPVTDPATGVTTYPNYPTDGTGPQLNIDTDPSNPGVWMPSSKLPAGHIISPDKNVDTKGDGKVDLPQINEAAGQPYAPVDANGDGVNDRWAPSTNMQPTSGYTGDETGDPRNNADPTNTGRPTVNVDVDGDGIPDVNIDTDDDGKPDVNLDPQIVSHYTDKNGDGKFTADEYTGRPTLNIDTNNTGAWQLSSEYKRTGVDDGIWSPDTNIDTNGDGVANIATLNRTGYPVLDADRNGVDDYWKPEIDIRGTTPQMETCDPTLNRDTTGDGKPDSNVDLDGDGKPDVNIDADKDGKVDTNIDPDIGTHLGNPTTAPDGTVTYPGYVNGGNKPGINVDTNGTGTWKPSTDPSDDGIILPDRNLDTNGDGNVDMPVLDQDPVDRNNDGVDDNWENAINNQNGIDHNYGPIKGETGNPSTTQGLVITPDSGKDYVLIRGRWANERTKTLEVKDASGNVIPNNAISWSVVAGSAANYGFPVTTTPVSVDSTGTITTLQSGICDVQGVYNGETVKITVIVPGDYTRDGRINTADVTAIMDVAVQDAEMNTRPYSLELADVSKDGRINTADVTTLIDLAVADISIG